jgi:hypothetical protein
MHLHFMTCVPIVVILIMPKRFQTADVGQVAVITGSRLK